ncbi:MAG TPA: glycine cleavage system aminomethyltransferase GcvT, partial [Stellaceae bacterium]|nr:glycine cleavage system aminomethyltransferase GcvT [Stellaceae bacterium]
MAEEKFARTPLYALHQRLGAKLVPFAGYEMPVQYQAGIIAEHLHTRTKASLFDVSHMGQVVLAGPDIAAQVERLVPADIIGLRSGRVRYTVFTNDRGGIIDDLMVAKDGEVLRLVVNASRKSDDLAHMRRALGDGAVTYLEDRALIALQGPAAPAVLARLAHGVEAMAFMSMAPVEIDGIACHVTRSGYTGEDGYEISAPGGEAEKLAQRLLAEPEVAPAGLGARDTLRLEAGL